MQFLLEISYKRGRLFLKKLISISPKSKSIHHHNEGKNYYIKSAKIKSQNSQFIETSQILWLNNFEFIDLFTCVYSRQVSPKVSLVVLRILDLVV